MQKQTQVADIPFVAILDRVGEIALRGAANLKFWQQRVAAEDLTVVEEQGNAKLLISAAIGKYNGIRFRELCVLVEVFADSEGHQLLGYYMPHAFNSVRLYAWIERTFFSCPYHYADVNATLEPAVTLSLTEGDNRYFAVSLATDARQLPCDETHWQGPVFLPTTRRPQFFIAKLSGATEKYAYGSDDTFDIRPDPRWPILDCLVESGFRPTEWRLRRSARHAKSKTMERTATTFRRYSLLSASVT